MTNKVDLGGRNAVVTGAVLGIGHATAARLLSFTAGVVFDISDGRAAY